MMSMLILEMRRERGDVSLMSRGLWGRLRSWFWGGGGIVTF